MAIVPDLSGNVPADEPPNTQPTIYSKMKFDSSGNLLVSFSAGAGAGQIQGNIATGTTDSGNPVKVGGVYYTAQPTFTDGQRGDLQIGSRGSLRVELFMANSSTAMSSVASSSDAGSNTVNALNVYSANRIFNGATWDRQYSVQGASAGAGLGVTAVHPIPNSSANAGVALTATTVAAGSLVLKASAGNLYGINVVAGASAGYLMIFNATSAPADGTVTPIFCMAVAANASLAFSWDIPIVCSTGITAVFSTTGPFTKTISTTAFIAGLVK